MAADRELHGADSRLHRVHAAVIASVAAQLGPLAELTSHAAPWFSATYEGIQHELHFACADHAALAALPDIDLELSCTDHVVVSLGVERSGDHARIDLLTVCCD